MSALTQWNPSRKSEELEVLRPLARWDHFREMEDMMHSGERKAEKEKKDLKFHRLERAYGRFERCFTLPDEADPDKITSEYGEGILTVHLPENPNVKTKVGQITVQ